MTVEKQLQGANRPVVVLGVGGTISMQGPRAKPQLDASDLVDSVPALRSVPQLSAETALSLPGAHLSLADALAVCLRAAEHAHAGRGVVVTTGTDTLEELAVMCALVHDAQAPIVFTGANRPASSPGADGPANLLDAVAVAGSGEAEGIGTSVCFGGELHAAMTVRKVDSVGPAAFGSPSAGPFGRVVEGRLWLHARPLRSPHVRPTALVGRVDTIVAGLGDDGELMAHAAHAADGIVLVALGAGHVPPPLLNALDAARGPVLVTGRPERSAMLFETYGFLGAEADVRATGAIPVPFLSAAGARIALLCCLGAGMDEAQIAEILAAYDAG